MEHFGNNSNSRAATHSHFQINVSTMCSSQKNACRNETGFSAIFIFLIGLDSPGCFSYLKKLTKHVWVSLLSDFTFACLSALKCAPLRSLQLSVGSQGRFELVKLSLTPCWTYLIPPILRFFDVKSELSTSVSRSWNFFLQVFQPYT